MLVRQTTRLTINPELKTIEGITKIDYSVTDQRTVSLFAKQMSVHSVQTDRSEALSFDYIGVDAQAQFFKAHLGSNMDTKDFRDTKFCLWDHENDLGGFLQIKLPPEGNAISVLIRYSLTNPVAGVRMYTYKLRHIVMAESGIENTRLWMPCVDTLSSKYPVTLEFHVPHAYTVVCSGQLEGRFQTEKAQVFQYLCENMYVDTIGFCVAEFEDIQSDAPHLTYFSLFSKDELLESAHFQSVSLTNKLSYTTNNPHFSIQGILKFLATEMGQEFPFKSYKLVFLPLAGTNTFSGVSIIDSKFLIDGEVYEKRVKTAEKLVYVIAFNWVGASMRCPTWADYWLILSLPNYLRKHFSKDTFEDPYYLKFYLRKSIKTYCSYIKKGLEVRPLCSLLFSTPSDLEFDKVYRLKGSIVLHMMENAIGRVHLSKAIKMIYSNCATSTLIKTIKKLCSINLRDFSKNWIYGMGAPSLKCTIKDNKEINKLEISILQTPIVQSYLDSDKNTQFKYLDDTNYEIPVRLNLMRFYSGPLKIDIYETDGAEIESSQAVLDLENQRFFTQISYKKTLRRQNPSRKKEETAEEKAKMLESTFLWVRIDPNFEMIREIELVQPENNWMEQIQKEFYDPLSQTDAIIGVKDSQDYENVLNILEGILNNERYYYKVRIQAAKTLSAISAPINAYKGLDYLIYYFKERHYENEVLLSNNFTDRSAYFLDKAVIKSIIKVRDMSLTHRACRIKVNSSFVVEFIADLIKNNDNSMNSIKDVYWMSNLLLALASTSNPVYVESIKAELKRSLSIDLVLGVPDHIISKASLQGFTKIAQFHKQDLSDFYSELISKLPGCSPVIQRHVVCSYIDYCVIKKISLLLPLQEIGKLCLSLPQFAAFYADCLWKMYLKLPFVNEGQEFTRSVWEMMTSPFAAIHSLLSSRLYSIFFYLKPIVWKSPSDRAWEWRIEEFEMGASHRVQAIDTTSGTWENWAREIYKRITNHEYSTPFLQPVDYEAEGLYDYPSIVSNPMDFGTVLSRLEHGEYSSFRNFSDDINLIFSNCKAYNQEGSELFNWAATLEEFFKVLSKPIETTSNENEGDLKVTFKINLN